MMHLNRQYFDAKCSELVQDIENKQMTSPSWLWMAAGAAAGLVLSCVRFKHIETRPFVAAFDKKEGDKKSGKFNRFRNSKDHPGFGGKKDK